MNNTTTYTYPKTQRYITRILCLLFAIVLTLVSCDDKGSNNKNNDDEYDLLPGVVSPGSDSGSRPAGNTGNTGNTGNSNYKKRVALTFDDGPHVSRTKAIVDELDKYGYNATFFVVGNRVDGTEYSGGKAMKYAYDAGNEIGIHGYTHKKYYNKCTDKEYYAELNNTVKAIRKFIPDYTPTLMRPIGGAITAQRVAESDYSVIMWNVDSLDWKYTYSDSSSSGAEQKLDTIVDNVMSSVSDGSIILMHDIYQSTLDATKEILRRLHEEGYDVVTVSELLGDEKQAGVRYSKGMPYKKEGD